MPDETPQSPPGAAASAVTRPADRRGTDGRPRSGSALVNASLLLGIVVIAGLTPVAARDALVEMPPLATGVVRFGIAGLLLLGTYALRSARGSNTASGIEALGDGHGSGARRAAVERRDYPRFLLAAVLCVPVNQFAFLTGVKWANASHAGLFYALNPVLVYVFTLLFGQGSRSIRMGLAAVIAFGGAGVVGWDGIRMGYGGRFVAGDVLLFFAVASWAGYMIAVAPLAAKYGAVRSVAMVMLLGSVLYSPAFLVDGHQLDFLNMSVRALGGFAFITLLTAYLNYILWGVALARIDINRLSVGVNAAPLLSVVAAYYWRNEPISRWLALGAALILTAITLANWDRFKALRANGHGVRAD